MGSRGEQGVSVFNATSVTTRQISASLQGEVKTISSQVVQKHGLILEKTPGARNLPRSLRNNHWEIRPGENMTREQFKKALKALSNELGGM